MVGDEDNFAEGVWKNMILSLRKLLRNQSMEWMYKGERAIEWAKRISLVKD